MNKIQPWTFLIQNQNFLSWQKFQTKVSSAALLSPKTSSAGFFVCPANYDSDVIYDLSELEFSGQKIDLQSENLDSLISEFIDLIKKSKQENKQFKIISVKDQLLSQVNEFIKSRGAVAEYNKQQYNSVLNLNLQLVTTNISKDLLPSNQNLSIELLYGFMIAYYGQEILEKCPQLAILMVTTPFINGIKAGLDLSVGQPKLKKLDSLLKKIKKMKNIPFYKRIQKKQFVDVFALRDYLQKKLNKIKENKDYSKSSKNKLLKLIHIINKHTQLKQNKFEVRQSIFNINTSSDDDYRLEDNWECLFYLGLKQALNRVQTCITIFNNQTLRNPQRHLIYPFLQSMSFSAIKKITHPNPVQKYEQLKKIALVTRDARKYRYYTSDWQNKLARAWNQIRNEILDQIKQDKLLKKSNRNEVKNQNESQSLQKLQIPPPMQYYLARDLCPYAYPYSFIYGRKQGYCLELENALRWFIRDSNKSEKAYFYSILQKPEISDKFDFLYEIPPQVRVFKPKHQDEHQFVTKLNQWLINNEESQEHETIKMIKSFVKDCFSALPKRFQELVKKLESQDVSILSLFYLIFHIYPIEELFLDEIKLKKPFKYEKYDKVIQSAKEEKIVDQNMYWGPSKYGGPVQNINRRNFPYLL